METRDFNVVNEIEIGSRGTDSLSCTSVICHSSEMARVLHNGVKDVMVDDTSFRVVRITSITRAITDGWTDRIVSEIITHSFLIIYDRRRKVTGQLEIVITIKKLMEHISKLPKN